MPKSGSGTSRPSKPIVREGKTWKMPDGSDLPKHLDGLKIPPAWTGTQVNPDPDGSLLVTGYDAKGRLQYVYSPKYMATQKAAKFARIPELDRQFDEIKSQNEENRLDPAKAEEADCMRVIMETGIRPGSDRDTKAAKQAYGATTLRGEHVVQTETGVRLQYTGKKGVSLDIPVDDPDTAAMLVSRAEEAGADGRLFDTDSHTLLQYSHTLGSGAFKVKDMRTYVGTSMAKTEVSKIPAPTSKTAYKKAVGAVAKAVSRKLGNTPSVALKDYIAPEVFDAWPGRAAFVNADGREPLFDFDIMVGTACRLREHPVTIKVVDDDPEGNDEDIPCPPEVRMALGFDPDELDEDKSHQVCIGNHCFFGNAISIAPSEHIAVLQGLNTWIDYKRPFGPQRFFYGADDFRGSEPEWETTPVVFAQQHPAHRLVSANLGKALASVRAHDGGPGRVAGRIRTPLIVGDAQPDLMAEVVFDDPYVQRMHAENRLALSTGFTAGHDDDGYLTERVKPNHLLVFVTDERNRPRDPVTGFLNKEGSNVTDEETKTAPAGDKSAPAKPEAEAPSSTEMRLKALISDLLRRLDEVFSSAEQLSEASGDAGDPDPAVSGRGQASEGKSRAEAKPRGQFANLNENHDEAGRFASGGGSGGASKGAGESKSETKSDTKMPSGKGWSIKTNRNIGVSEEDIDDWLEKNFPDAESMDQDSFGVIDVIQDGKHMYLTPDDGFEDYLIQSEAEFEESVTKENMNDCHGDDGRFCEGSGGSSGGKEPTGEARVEASKMSKGASERREALDKGTQGHRDQERRASKGGPSDKLIALRLASDEGRDYAGLPSGENLTTWGEKIRIFQSVDHAEDVGVISPVLAAAYRATIADTSVRDEVKEIGQYVKSLGLSKSKSNQADLSNADYPWDDCIADQLKRGYDQAKAEKICGYIKAKNNLQEMMDGRSPAGSDLEEDIMGTEMDALKSKLDAANQTVTAKTTELDETKRQLDAANQKLAAFEQAQKDAAWENMKTTHVPKGWLAGADDAAKANKEAELRKEYETNPVGFANKLLAEMKGRGGQDKSKEEGMAFGNSDGATDVVAVSRELRALSGR
jgi:DNA topoisomerase-1